MHGRCATRDAPRAHELLADHANRVGLCARNGVPPASEALMGAPPAQPIEQEPASLPGLDNTQRPGGAEAQASARARARVPFFVPKDESVTAATLGPKYLQVRPSRIEGAGDGLFVRRRIRAGTVMCEYAGTRLSLAQMLRTTDKSYVMGGFGLNNHIDGRLHKDFHARYINDHADPEATNARFIKCRATRKALVVAMRDIHPGEEVYCPYGQVYWRAASYEKGGAPSVRPAHVGTP